VQIAEQSVMGVSVKVRAVLDIRVRVLPPSLLTDGAAMTVHVRLEREASGRDTHAERSALDTLHRQQASGTPPGRRRMLRAEWPRRGGRAGEGKGLFEGGNGELFEGN
jgi:hypothetical protein